MRLAVLAFFVAIIPAGLADTVHKGWFAPVWTGAFFVLWFGMMVLIPDRCPWCKSRVRIGARVCSHCGRAVQ